MSDVLFCEYGNCYEDECICEGCFNKREIRYKNLEQENKQLQERLKEAELALASIYNIDTKYIDTEYQDRVDMFYNDILDLVEEYQQKYKRNKND